MSDDDRDNDIESDTDKRAHHNALERKRRDHIKDSFSMLRDALPFFQADKVRASRAQILKKAADYITTMRRKNVAHQQDVDDLKSQNKALEEQIRLLEKAKTPENLNSANAAIDNAKVTLKKLVGYHSPEYGNTSDSDDSSDISHDSNDNPRKRQKKDTGSRI